MSKTPTTVEKLILLASSRDRKYTCDAQLEVLFSLEREFEALQLHLRSSSRISYPACLRHGRFHCERAADQYHLGPKHQFCWNNLVPI